jgi:hypothetical protein
MYILHEYWLHGTQFHQYQYHQQLPFQTKEGIEEYLKAKEYRKEERWRYMVIERR